MKFRNYILFRFISCLVTIWIGVTVIFFIPRFFPSDPVENMIAQTMGLMGHMHPVEIETMRAMLNVQFGLDGSLWEQYVHFLRNGLLRFDFGPSLINFPTPTRDIILTRLPYTLFLSLFTTIVAWIIGNLIGLRAGFRSKETSSKILESIAICIYPIPYFILAIVLQIVFAFWLGWFPLIANIMTQGGPWLWFTSLIRSSVLPALSMLLIGTGWWIISMKALSATTSAEDFVMYARLRGLSEKEIGKNYVWRNSIITQVTALALGLGGVFSGALLTEIIFGYPGVGTLIQTAILRADYNMILGTITISIVAISVSTFLVDIIYPFIDPRVRYR